MAQIVRIVIDGDGVTADLPQEAKDSMRTGIGTMIATSLEGGMVSGNPSIAFISEMDDGNWVAIQMSLAMLQTVHHAFLGKYGVIR